jgi:hypothetical protein
MSRTTRVMQCRPDDVFAVLADGWSYATWVVGAARIREVEEAWPDPGSKIHHSVGAWPALLDDTTVVEHVDAPHELALRARAWPTGEARVVVHCRPEGDRTEVTIDEQVVSGPARLLPTLAQDALLNPRNVEALRRLSYLAEGRARKWPGGDGPGSAPGTRDRST